MRTVLTDIGGVVLLPNPELWAELRRRGAPDNAEEICFGPGSPWELSRVGSLSYRDYVRTVAVQTGIDPRSLGSMLESSQWTVNGPMVEWLKSVRTLGVKVVAVSNADFTLNRNLAKNRLMPLFDAIVNSSCVGIAKPDPGIYEIALNRAACPPTECLFIDDKERNIPPAHALGILTLVYRDYATFATEVAGFFS